MQDFHYYIKKIGDKAEMLLTDTDILILIKPYAQKNNLLNFLITFLIIQNVQNFAMTQITFSCRQNERWKKGVLIKGFVGTKSKMYTFITGNHESKKQKGINKNIADDELKYEDNKNFSLIDHVWDTKWIEFKAKVVI